MTRRALMALIARHELLGSLLDREAGSIGKVCWSKPVGVFVLWMTLIYFSECLCGYHGRRKNKWAIEDGHTSPSSWQACHRDWG